MKKYLTVDEVSKMICYSKSWVYDRVQCGVMPHVRIERKLLFDPDAIESWLKSGGDKEPVNEQKAD